MPPACHRACDRSSITVSRRNPAAGSRALWRPQRSPVAPSAAARAQVGDVGEKHTSLREPTTRYCVARAAPTVSGGATAAPECRGGAEACQGRDSAQVDWPGRRREGGSRGRDDRGSGGAGVGDAARLRLLAVHGGQRHCRRRVRECAAARHTAYARTRAHRCTLTPGHVPRT